MAILIFARPAALEVFPGNSAADAENTMIQTATRTAGQTITSAPGTENVRTFFVSICIVRSLSFVCRSRHGERAGDKAQSIGISTWSE